MTTFDVSEVRRFAAEIDARLDDCDNGEGLECTNLDGTLRQYAILCCQFSERVRAWGRAVFDGQAAFAPEVEKLWLTEGELLVRRANELWSYGQEGDCLVLQNGAALGAALWRMEHLLTNWTTPQRAVAPVARHGLQLTPGDKLEAQNRLAALPPLPADWQHINPRRRTLTRKLRRSQGPSSTRTAG